MEKYFYPAVFHKEDTGYSVSFPDFPGCYTQGEDMAEASEMAFDALGLYLEDTDPADYPKPSNFENIKTGTKEIIVLIPFSPLAYAQKWNTHAVRKSLTIPAWLNNLALTKHINYSQVLQEALKKELQVNEK
jgi:antitoxin HicB